MRMNKLLAILVLLPLVLSSVAGQDPPAVINITAPLNGEEVIETTPITFVATGNELTNPLYTIWTDTKMPVTLAFPPSVCTTTSLPVGEQLDCSIGKDLTAFIGETTYIRVLVRDSIHGVVRDEVTVTVSREND